jgi:hypothetical protein
MCISFGNLLLVPISTLIPPNQSLSYLPKAWIGKEAIIIAKEKESNGKGKSNLAWYKPVSLLIIFTISLRTILVRCVLSGIIFYMYDSFCYVTVAIVELNRERVVLRLLVMLEIQKNMCQTVLFLS